VILDSDWKGYRGEVGDLGADAKVYVYHAVWRGLETIFHVAPLMDAEQHRRLCGNDIGTSLLLLV